MSILIVGSNGLIGTFLEKYLNGTNDINLLSFSDNHGNAFFSKLDLTNKSKVIKYTKSCQKFNIVIFLVGLAHKKGKKKDLKVFRKINYETLFNLLSGLKKNNKIPDKIIFTSTISVYGEHLEKKIFFEDSCKSPQSPYAKTKLEAEKYLLNNFNKQAWILRLAPVYSKKFKLNIDRRIKILNFFYKIGDGSKILSLCNIKNIGKVIDSINNGYLPRGIYNLSDKKEYKYIDLLKDNKAKYILRIPRIILKFIYIFGKITGNYFLKDNSIKLLSDNIYPSKKICKYVNLEFSLKDND